MNRQLSILLLFLLLAAPTATMAQMLKVESFRHRMTYVIPESDKRYDLDHDPCALVIVQVGDTIVKVEGNIMATPGKNDSIVRHGMEQWFYMTDGTKKFTVKFKHHFTVDIETAHYGIDRLQGNCTYVLTLTDPNSRTTTANNAPVRATGSAATTPASGSTPASVSGGSHTSPTPTKKTTFGIRVGMNMATTQFDKQYDGTNGTMGFHFGLALDVPLGGMLHFAPALLFSSKGYQYDDGIVVETAKAQYIDLPLQAALRLSLGSTLALQIEAGPYIALGIGGNIKDDKAKNYDQPFFDHYGSMDYGLQAGLSLVIANHLSLGTNYQAGMGDYRNRNLGISLGYIF